MVKSPTHNLCIGRVLSNAPLQRSFTQVGVGWDNGSNIKCTTDITVIIGPDDELFLFPRKESE